MTLVDTSIWIDHLQKGNRQLENLLLKNQVLIHPFIIGEISLGVIGSREEVLALLNSLPKAKIAENDEVLQFIERHGLVGIGIGWIDAHLLASVRLSHARMMTTDKAMIIALRKVNATYQ